MKRITLLLLPLLFAPSASAQTTYIRAARMFDGKSDGLLLNMVIKVEGTKITQVGSNLSIPAGAHLIDLGDRTMMPGMIDAHTHIALHAGPYDEQVLRESPEFRAIASTVNALKTLRAGVTTIRDVGNEGAGLTDIALRDAIAQGLVPGPRILAAIRPVVTTGAYRIGRLSPLTTPPAIASEANGADPLRQAVRELIMQGADVIKVYLDSSRKPQGIELKAALTFSQAELNAIVHEAHSAGLRVAGHASTDAATRMGVQAGVDSIEHGMYIGEETFRMMADQGIVYVPTLLVYEMWANDPDLIGEGAPRTKAQLMKVVEEHHAAFRRALRTPVKIAFGTDTFEKTGTNPQELGSMVRLGMKPIDALRSATSTSAALLGIERITGTIEPGKSADIIAMPGNPLGDITAVAHVSFVMKEGKVYVGK